MITAHVGLGLGAIGVCTVEIVYLAFDISSKDLVHQLQLLRLRR